MKNKWFLDLYEGKPIRNTIETLHDPTENTYETGLIKMIPAFNNQIKLTTPYNS